METVQGKEKFTPSFISVPAEGDPQLPGLVHAAADAGRGQGRHGQGGRDPEPGHYYGIHRRSRQVRPGVSQERISGSSCFRSSFLSQRPGTPRLLRTLRIPSKICLLCFFVFCFVFLPPGFRADAALARRPLGAGGERRPSGFHSRLRRLDHRAGHAAHGAHPLAAGAHREATVGEPNLFTRCAFVPIPPTTHPLFPVKARPSSVAKAKNAVKCLCAVFPSCDAQPI